MTESVSHQFVIWIARVAGGVSLLAVWYWFSVRRGHRRSAFSFRCCWTLAWLLLVLHVAAAFHWVHHWDHAAAIAHTAAMTERVTGWSWSGGLYINYVFLLVWGADVAGLWLGRWIASPLTVQLVSGFMWFNATVVFGTLWWLLPIAAWIVACWFLPSRATMQAPA